MINELQKKHEPKQQNHNYTMAQLLTHWVKLTRQNVTILTTTSCDWPIPRGHKKCPVTDMRQQGMVIYKRVIINLYTIVQLSEPHHGIHNQPRRSF